mgnify:CR=1 FL=1
MKHLRKIAALILSCVMVFGMASVVYATGGPAGETSGSGATGTGADSSGTTATTGNGKITIENAKAGQTYTIYRILDLESYDPTARHYAYKAATTQWKRFLEGKDINDTYVTIDGEYVTWKEGVAETKAAEFAKKALQYAKEKSLANAGKETAKTTSVEFTGLPLGYYLVDSSVGALCSLGTTTGEVTIREKNAEPTVEKKVQEDSNDEYGESNTADIGQTVEFQTTIKAQEGAEKYVLHDKMSEGLTFDGNVTVTITKGTSPATPVGISSYTLQKPVTTATALEDGCTFELSFNQGFCNTLADDDIITVSYSAVLNEKAVIADAGNKNETWLSYGDNNKTIPQTTTTKTYSISVFKYVSTSTSSKEGLAKAEFTISKNADGSNPIKLVEKTETEATYLVAKKAETGTTTTIITPESGKFKIEGLDADTYYLTETKQPDGYNKLAAPVKVTIDENGTVTMGDSTTPVTTVEIENKTGSLLPSTGGRGTTLFYILGGILVLGSAVVLITKRRMK